MFSSASIKILLALFAASFVQSQSVSSDANLHFIDDHHDPTVHLLKQTLLSLSHHIEENAGDAGDVSQRNLAQVCIGPGNEIYYFEVSIRIVPDSSTTAGSCGIADQVYLGNDINHLLLDYGLGDAGVGDGAVFLAGVCSIPETANSTNAGIMTERRRLMTNVGFVFSGGGGCRFCITDSSDGRKLLRGFGEARKLQTSNWFTDTFAPQMTITVQNAILNDLAPNHQLCLGLFPTVEVNFNEVTIEELNLSCDDGKPIQSLHSLSLSESSVMRKAGCGKCASINFSTTGSGSIVTKGTYVSQEWRAKTGLVITASGGYTPNSRARIFDTTDSTCVNANGNEDFGRVNCVNGDENCENVGNILIIQKDQKSCPDVDNNGGSLIFTWDEPILLSDIGLMDIDEEDQRIKITYADGFIESFTYEGFGDNTVQRVVVSKVNVVKLEVIFTGSGAVTEINFCPFCMTTLTHDDDKFCLYTEDESLMEPEEVIAFDDFEGSNALDGWTEGKLDGTQKANFTTFLGRYGNGMKPPFKSFNIPRGAVGVIIELDFYEIDSWSWKNGNAKIFVDGEAINLGKFQGGSDEGHREETTPLGLWWTMDSITWPEQLGFNAWPDQKHRIRIIISRTSGLFDDQALRLTLHGMGTTLIENESAGWDNVKVIARFGCKGQTKPETVATRSKLFPEITGPFIVEAKVRFDHNVTQGSWAQGVFCFGMGSKVTMQQHKNTNIMQLVVKRDGMRSGIYAYDAIVGGELATWKASVNSHGLMQIEKNGNVLAQGHGYVPRHIHRVGDLVGFGRLKLMHYPEMFRGTVLGIDVVNSGEVSTGKLLNIPKQVDGPFIAKVIATISDPTLGSRQTIFDFSNGPGNDQIRFGLYGKTNGLQLEVWRNGVMYNVTAPDAVVAGITTTWRTGVDAMGIMWIEKDGVRIASNQGIVPAKVTRSRMEFSTSSNNDTPLQGSILGFRISSTPCSLEEITGPVMIRTKARFGDVNIAGQRIFDFRSGPGQDIISFGQVGTTRDMQFIVSANGGTPFTLVASDVIVDGELADWMVGVDPKGFTFIAKNGKRVAENYGSGIVPPNVHRRIKQMGVAADGKLVGTVLGMDILGPYQNSEFGMKNSVPKQLTGAFNATAIVRFNTIETTKYQRVFHFSNGGTTDDVWFGQRGDSRDIMLVVHRPDVGSKGRSFEAIASQVIIPGEIATWRCGVDVSGVLWIAKNGIRLAEAQGAVPRNVVRSNMGVGLNPNTNENIINGMVIGLRFD